MWAKLISFLLLGYLCMGRTFAYLGVPPLHLYIGEIVLALFVVFGPRITQGRWIWMPIKCEAIRSYNRWFQVFLIFGAFQIFYGIYQGHPLLLALRDFATNYYPLYFSLGVWVSFFDPGYLRRFIRFAAWTNGVYGLLYIFVLSQLSWSFTGFSQNTDPIQAFGQPSFSAAILLGLICYERNIREVWIPLCLNVFVLLGVLIRAEWFGFAVGLLLWACFSRNLRKLAVAGALVLAVVAAMYWADFSYEAPTTRGGTISATDIVGRAVAPVNADLAKDYTSDVQQFEGNAVWRTLFWAQVWGAMNDSTAHQLFGLGYGYPLNNLQPSGLDTGTRTPHSILFWTLGYTGWIGLLLFACFQISLVRMLWLAYRRTGQSYGLVFFVAMIAFSCFTPFFEVPQGAIPFYLIAGCASAGLLSGGGSKAFTLARDPATSPITSNGLPLDGRTVFTRGNLVATE